MEKPNFSLANISPRALVGYAVLIANLFTIHSVLIGCIGIIFYFAPILKRFGSLQTVPFMILLSTVAYYAHGIDRWTTLMILLVPVLLMSTTAISFQHNPAIPRVVAKKNAACIIAAIVDAVLLMLLFAHRTEGLLPSPWTGLGPRFFLLFAFSTALVFHSLSRRERNIPSFLLTAFHLFVFWSVAAIVYPLGFGFDAFVHRATEMWIQIHGSIQPLEPYYIGQYASVVWLSNVTGVPIFFVDAYVVPTLAAILLPVAIMKSRLHLVSSFLILFIPALSLHLTTPHNLALLLALLTVYAAFAMQQGLMPPATPLLLSGAAFVTHPLVGAPSFLFALSMVLATSLKKRTITILVSMSILVALLPSLLFAIHLGRVTGTLPTLVNPSNHMSDVFSLFKRPYWYATRAPLRFEILYAWERWIVPCVIVLSALGVWLCTRRGRIHSTGHSVEPFLYIGATIGMCVSAVILRSSIVFPNVVSYEQGDYPSRLLNASIIFLLPFGGYAITSFIETTQKIEMRLLRYGLTILVSVLLMLSLYLAYPQRNAKARFPGFNVTRSDIDAVQWIHDQRASYDYVVLADQLVSAAALTKYSFARYFTTTLGQVFYYALPTGGELYREYGRMIYEGQKREYMTDAMELTGTKTAYFVVNSYWANSGSIIGGAKKTADRWVAIDNGAVWVFEYTRK